MATAVGLSFQLTASAVGMAKGIGDASNQLAKLGISAQKAASDLGVLKTLEIGKTFISSVQSLGTTFAGYVSGISSSVEATSNLARELGISYEQLTQLQVAAQLSGVSADSLAKAFTRAQVTITKAAQGGKEAVQALAAIGLQAGDLQGLSSSEQFNLLATAIANIADPAQRAAAAVAIFGRSGAELLPVFRELGGNLATSRENLDKFRGGVSGLEAAAVADLGDKFTLVGKDIEIVATKLLAQLAPALTQAADKFITFLASLDIGAIAQTATGFINGLGGAIEYAYTASSVLSPILSAIAESIQFVAENGRGAGIGVAVAATALGIYKVAAIASTVATIGLGGAIRALLASTGIGLLVTLFGAVAGAALEWGLATNRAGEQAQKGAQGAANAAASAGQTATQMGQDTAAALAAAFNETETAAKKAADAAKKSAEAARREADQAIQRLVTEQQFGGDSQRYAAAQAVKAIEEDIRNTENEITAAREAGDQAAINAGTQRLAQLDQAMARERDIASGARKAAEERAKMEAELGRQRVKFEEQIAAAFRRPTDPLKLEDVRSVSGYEALQRFSQDQSQDPAIEEYRKQLKELQAIRRELAKADQPETVDILGG